MTPLRVGSSVNLLQGSRPVAERVSARRLRVLRGSAADPLNLLQVMLAKGTRLVFPPAASCGNATNYMLLLPTIFDQAALVAFGLPTINFPNHQPTTASAWASWFCAPEPKPLEWVQNARCPGRARAYCNDLAPLSAHQRRHEKAVIGLDSRV